MNLFTGFIQGLDWSYLVVGVAALFSIVFHELSHGFIALKLGDTTAKQLGRLTLNPIKHVDIFGLLMLIVVGFGWAKPVPVDIRNFKNPKEGMALTALAGPVSNLILAFASVLLLALLSPIDNEIVSYIKSFLVVLAVISIGLGIFNLIPIPPLDGSKVLFSILPDSAYYNVLQYERFGILALIIILNTGIITPYLEVARSAIINVIFVLVDLIVPW